MTRRSLLLSVAVAATAGLAAVAGDTPAFAALLGLIGGALAAVIALGGNGRSAEPEAPAPTAEPAHDNRPAEIIGAMADPMLLLDGGTVAAANPAARKLLGEWIEGRDVRLALRHPSTVEALAAASNEGRIERLEIMGLGESERRWLMTVAPLDGGWRLIHLADRSEAAAAEQIRVDFVANASHELRTPLATLLGFIETLRDDDAGGDAALRARFLGIMNDEARRMQQLIEDLMSLSRIEAERFRPPRDPVDLVPLVEEVRDGCGQLLAQRGNTLAVENMSTAAQVQGDRGQLLQLIRNLVVNAVKYGKPGTEVTVRIDDESSESVRLSVIDRGEGIGQEHLPRLTERFYRVDNGRSRAEGGTGLGLAIVKHIVGRHRGRLEIKSRIGEGTAVHVSLPRVAAPPEPAAVTSVSS
jgi:two-component system phosphate regulon sensor histidine kinase PhoR